MSLFRMRTSDPRIDFFDRLADDWDNQQQSLAETIRQIERYADRLALQAGMSLLEVGCGTGQLTGWLLEQVRPGRVLAVDFSPKMLAHAVQKVRGADFRLADVCTDELGVAEFDLALCFHSFPHFRDPPAALRNIARALKPYARLVVLHLDCRAEVNAFHRGVGGAIAGDFLPDDPQWLDWLASAGFNRPIILDDDGFFLQATRTG